MSQPIKNTLDTPIPQPFYHFLNGAWHPTTTAPNPSSLQLHSLRLTTWNIDFHVPYSNQRMNKALSYLSTLHPSTNTTPSIIFLQEMVSSDLTLIQQQPWIQHHFYITDISESSWASSYGTTTLIDKRLAVRGVFRARYSNSQMGRDGLFVDIGISGALEDEDSTSPIIRLCNTHLESMTSHPPRRPMQIRLAAQFMRADRPSVLGDNAAPPVPYGAILAGDLNAFAPEDLTAPEECGLQDAFLVLGGQDGTEESFTWGQQVPEYVRHEFGCSRMDKVLFCGGVEVRSLEKIGAGEKIWIEYPQDSSDSEESSETGKEIWVTDHIGLQAVFRIVR